MSKDSRRNQEMRGTSMREIADIKTPVMPCRDGGATRLMYVLLEDKPSEAKIAYMGLVDLPDVADKVARREAADWVAAVGRKLSYDEAHIQFPSLAKRKYQK